VNILKAILSLKESFKYKNIED
jgi:hypothetical protein